MASELDDLEHDLLQAADTWFDQNLHLKLQRLIAIAKNSQRRMPYPDQPGNYPLQGVQVPRDSPELTGADE